MTIENGIKERIELAVALLTRSEYLRPGMSYNDFSKEYSQIIAQAKQDRALLEGAGMDFTQMPYYEGLLEILSVEHAVRVNAEANLNTDKSAFSEAMPAARANRAMLMAVARYVVSRSDRPEAKRVYNIVRKGNGDGDTLNDNITLVGFVRRFADLAKDVRPGGEVIDEARLAAIEADALRLLRLRGEATVSANSTAEAVDRQQRLLTLCIRARNEIKLFAEAAFYADNERYKRSYAGQARKSSAKSEDAPVSETEQAAL